MKKKAVELTGTKVLIVAKCIVNLLRLLPLLELSQVLIVAKCIVNV